jgi:hypothetical protein
VCELIDDVDVESQPGTRLPDGVTAGRVYVTDRAVTPVTRVRLNNLVDDEGDDDDDDDDAASGGGDDAAPDSAARLSHGAVNVSDGEEKKDEDGPRCADTGASVSEDMVMAFDA